MYSFQVTAPAPQVQPSPGIWQFEWQRARQQDDHAESCRDFLYKLEFCRGEDFRGAAWHLRIYKVASVEMSCSTQKQVVFIATVPFPQNKNNGLLLESPALLSTMYSQPKFHCFIHLKQNKKKTWNINRKLHWTLQIICWCENWTSKQKQWIHCFSYTDHIR